MSNYERVSGRNAVRETLKSGRNINKLYISENHDSGLVNIIKMAKSKGISIQKTNRHKLDSIAGNPHHQGVIALCSPVETVSLRELTDKLNKKEGKPLVVILVFDFQLFLYVLILFLVQFLLDDDSNFLVYLLF